MPCEVQSHGCMQLMLTEVGVLDEERGEMVQKLRSEDDPERRVALSGLISLLGTIRETKWECLRSCPHFASCPISGANKKSKAKG